MIKTTTKEMTKLMRKAQAFQRKLKVYNELSMSYEEEGMYINFSIKVSEEKFDTLSLYYFLDPEVNEMNLEKFIMEHQ